MTPESAHKAYSMKVTREMHEQVSQHMAESIMVDGLDSGAPVADMW